MISPLSFQSRDVAAPSKFTALPSLARSRAALTPAAPGIAFSPSPPQTCGSAGAISAPAT